MKCPGACCPPQKYSVITPEAGYVMRSLLWGQVFCLSKLPVGVCAHVLLAVPYPTLSEGFLRVLGISLALL